MSTPDGSNVDICYIVTYAAESARVSGAPCSRLQDRHCANFQSALVWSRPVNTEACVTRRYFGALSLLVAATASWSCFDEPRSLTAPRSADAPRAAIVDESRGGPSEFFWLPPTVASAPSVTGAFDGSALNDLVVEVCELAADNTCVAGAPVAQFTSTGTPVPQRISLNAAGEYYTVNWLTGISHVNESSIYRVRVLRSGDELGYLDVQFVGNTPALTGIDQSQYVGVKRGQQLTLRFRIDEPSARTRVRLNEVESSGGVPGDWIELYNPSSVPLSLAGYVVRDGDDAHTYTLAADATIPAGGYFLVEEADLGFGLGGADAARFYAPDGTTLIDSYAWTAHAASTYGRCPDGSGAFQTTTAITKGAANDCRIIVVINEVESSAGSPGDWVEIFNPGLAPADIGGFTFSDADDTHRYVIPSGTVVPAGGYAVLEEAAFAFGLGAADAARLFRPDGSLVDSYAWTSHAFTTYARCPDGTGAFTTATSSTKGAANDCSPPPRVVINEVESNGGTPGDWVELYNPATIPADISGYGFLDNDNTHTPYIIPAGTTIAPGGYYVLDEASFGFGLGGADAARVFGRDGSPVDSYAWTTHAPTTYARCPNGAGSFITSVSSTKGATNDCVPPAMVINEVESNGGTPGDWVELYNPAAFAVDISGYLFRDNDDVRAPYVIPAGSVVGAGSYFVLDEATFAFGLGAADAARLYRPDGTPVDSYSWTAHATTTFGRCPNATGPFATTLSATKGGANVCVGSVVYAPWPGDGAVQTASDAAAFGGNLSGLSYQAATAGSPAVLWAAKNGPGTLYRLVWNGSTYAPDVAEWSVGKSLRYPDGTGNVDAEGVTVLPGTSTAYVGSERNNDVSAVSRNSILRYDVSVGGPELIATHEWNLSADLPVTGPNLGVEAITGVSDDILVAHGFFDERLGHAYNPAEYANHGSGLFLVGVEATGTIYAYALDHSTGGYARVATIASGHTGVMALEFDADNAQLWAFCDDTCQGHSSVLRISATTGRFAIVQQFARPIGMPNLNNEGVAFAPVSECVAGMRTVIWSDDAETGGFSLRRGTVTCASF